MPTIEEWLKQQDNSEQTATNLSLAVDANPQAATDAIKQARRNAIPPSLMGTQPDPDFTRRNKLEDASEAVRRAPTLEQWLNSQPEIVTAAVHDDLANLSALDKAISVAKGSGNALISGVHGFNEGFYGLVEAGGAVLPDALGDGIESFGRRARLQEKGLKDASMPQTTNPLAAGWYSGLQSTSQMAMTLPAAVALTLAGNPAAAATLSASTAAALTGGQSFGQARDEGKDIPTSVTFGTEQGLVEYLTESIPALRLFGDLNKGSALGRMVRNQLASEIPGEQLATALQDFNEWAVLHPERPFSEYLAERPEAALSTAVATLVGGGAISATTMGLDAVISRVRGEDRKVRQAQQMGEALRGLQQLAEATATRERDVETLESFLQTATDGSPVEALYIDGQKLVDSGLADKLAAASPAVASQLAQAQVGTMIRIPTSEVLGRFNQELAPLLPEMRTDPNGMSQREADKFVKERGPELQAEIEKVLGGSEQTATDQEARQRVRETVAADLLATGRVTRDVADAYASLTSAFYHAMGARMGKDAETLYNEERLRIMGDGAGEFDQSNMMGINVRNDTQAGLRYADDIVDGKKKYETRDTDSLRPYVGKRVAIVRTGEGKAKAIGEVTLGEPIVVNEEQFRQMQADHLVPAGSTFDVKPGGVKYLYPVTEPTRYNKEKDVGAGIVSRQVLEQKPYETDIFGNPLSAAPSRKARSADQAMAGGNVSTVTPVFDNEAAGTYLVRTEPYEAGRRELGIDVVKTPSDAAQAFSMLARNTKEHFGALLTDDAGKPLALVGVTQGTVNAASVYNLQIVAEAMRVKGATRMWLGHNHPSGNPGLSRADNQVSESLGNIFDGSSIRVEGILAIGGGTSVAGRAWTFAALNGRETTGTTSKPVNKASVPIIDRQFTAHGYSAIANNPSEAERAARTISNGETGLMLLDQKRSVVGFLPMSALQMGNLRNTGNMETVFRALSMSNANAVVVVSSNGEVNEQQTKNIGSLLATLDVQLLDNIDISSGRSMASTFSGLPHFSNQFYQSVSLRRGSQTLRKYGLDPNGKYKTREVAAALEARQREKWGAINPDDRSPEAMRKIAGWMTEEVMFAMENPEQSGVGWYSVKFQRAIDTFAKEFPELATDKSARDIFTILVAITSDGQKVLPNFAQAADIYGRFRKGGESEGKFTTKRGHARQASIDTNLERIQQMHDELGADGMRDFLMQERTVRELKQVAKEQGKELRTAYQVDVVLPMAAVVLGPKLGAFYANLMGAHGYLTMDRWWSRTFNRYRGTLLQAPTRQGLDRFKQLYAADKKLNRAPEQISDDEVLSFVVEYRNSYEAKGYKNGTEIEKAANTIYKMAFENLEDTPFNSSDRTFMLDSVAQAAKNLKRRGVTMSVADIQAVLWYYEKRLYGELGARQTADISYEEAANRVVEARASGTDLAEGPAVSGADGNTASGMDEGIPPGEEDFQPIEAGGEFYQSSNSNAPRLATWFSGGRTLEGAIANITSVMAVEHDGKISGFANTAWGTEFSTRGVEEVDPQELIDADVTLFHASPVCKNFSAAKTLRGATELDLKSAESIARAIREAKPPMVTVENVPEYRNTALFKLITDALDEAGYKYEVIVHNATDFGGAQSRERMLLRAVREGSLPPVPAKVAPGDWMQVIGDLLDAAPTDTIPPEERRRLDDMIAKGKLDPTRPIITMGGSGFHGTWAAANDGGPAPTLKSANEKPRVIMPDGTVRVVTPRMMARLMGLPDSFKVPDSRSFAKLVLGNGIHGDVTRALIVPMLEQQGGNQFQQEERGSFSPSELAIRLTKAQNLSTFLHESGHFYLHMLASLATRPDAPADIIADAHTALAWMGVEAEPNRSLMDTWMSMNIEQQREYHEKFARGFEVYLREGKAPSVELEGVFSKFRAWLINVYKQLMDAVRSANKTASFGQAHRAPLSDEVRAVFDRMLATEDEIKAAQAARSMGLMFASAEEAAKFGIDWEAYQEQGKASTDAAVADLDAQRIRNMKWLANARSRLLKKLQRDYTDLRRTVRNEARAEAMANPVYQAWEFLTTPLKASDRERWQKAVRSANVEPEVDSLMTAIAKLGGLQVDEVSAQWGFDPADMRGASDRTGFGNFKPVARRKGGKSIEEMAELLADLGYIAVDENGKHVLEDFHDKLEDGLTGRDHFSNAADWTLKMYGPQSETLTLDVETGVTGAWGGRFDYDGLIQVMGVESEFKRLMDMGMVRKAGGDHPDAVAEAFGFTSGEQLVRELMASRSPHDYIEGLTDAKMLERYSELATPQAREDSVNRALASQAAAKVQATELAALEKAMNAKGKNSKGKSQNTLPSAAKSFAEQVIARLVIREIRPSQFTGSASRAGKAAAQAMKGGKVQEAALEKRNQLVNTYAARAASDALDEVERGVTYLKRFANEGTRKNLDQDYLDQIDALLERYELRKVSNKGLDKRKALADWISEQEAMGITPDLPPHVADAAKRANYRELSVEEFRGLVESVRQIEHFARLKKKLLLAKDKREFQALVTDLRASIAQHAGNRHADNLTRGDVGSLIMNGLKMFSAAHRKMASLAYQADGFKDGGLLWETIVRTANEQSNWEATKQAEMTQRLATLLKALPRAEHRFSKGKWFERIGRSLTQEMRLTIALNWGNEGNKQRLMSGYRWTPYQVQEVLDSLTQEEWQFVQGVWDAFESLRPAIAEKERRVMGKEPDWVQPTPVTTPFGQLRGGYFPIVYDPRQNLKAEENEAAEAAKRQLQGARSAATTRRNFVKARAAEVTGRPVLLTMDGMFRGLTDVIHDLAFHEWLIDANRVMRAVDGDLRETYGSEFIQQFRSAIEAIAAGEANKPYPLDGPIRHVRIGAMVAGLGFNIVNAVLQPLGFTQSIVRIGGKWVAIGVSRFVTDPAGSARMVLDKSEFMRNRKRTQNRELNELRNRVRGKSEVRQQIDAAMFLPMTAIQMTVDFPTWMAAYEKAGAEGHDDDTAVQIADQAVIASQGGGQLKDLAAIQRGPEFAKLFTVFYGYFSTAYNLGAERYQATSFRSPAQVFKLGVDFLLLYSVPAVLGLLIKEAFSGGDDDEEELANKLAREQLSYLFGLMVGVREFTGAAQLATGTQMKGAAGYGGPAGLRFMQEVTRLAQQVNQGEFDRALVRAGINVGGIVTHLPSAQINRTLDGVIAISEGQAQNPVDAARMAVAGAPR